MKILTLRRSMQKIYISQNEKLSFVMNADQLQFVKFLFPWYAAKDKFCCEQISGIFLYHCWESYSFQMLWLIHGWAMHREEIRNKICLIWLFSPISQINISNRDDIWQDKKMPGRQAKLGIFIKITNVLAIWDDRWRQRCWNFRSFIPTRRRMQDELCKIGKWWRGMNLII